MTTANCSVRREIGALLPGLLRRNLGPGLLLLAAFFATLPFPYLLTAVYRNYYRLNGTANLYEDSCAVFFFALMLLAPFLTALRQAHWMHNPRQAVLFQSLPVRRRSLFLANAAAAFLTVALPLTVNFALVLAVGAVYGNNDGASELFFPFRPEEILLDWFCWLVLAFCITVFVLLAAVPVGRMAENAFFALLLMGAPAAVLLFSVLVMQQYLVGYPLRGGDCGSFFIYALCPLMPVFFRTDPSLTGGPGEGLAAWVYLAWLAAGCLLLWLACRLYQRRPCERAGAPGAALPLFLYGQAAVTFLSGLWLGMFLHGSVTVWDQEAAAAHHLLPLVPTMAVCALAGAAAYQLIFGGGLRGMKKALPAMAVMVIATTVTALILTTDGLGYVDRIPDPDRVEHVTVEYRGRYGELARQAAVLDRNGGLTFGYRKVVLSTPEGIRAAEAVHRSLLAKAKQRGEHSPWGGEIQFWYSGGLTREYSQYLSHFWDQDPRDLEPLLALEENPEFRRQTDPRFTILPEDILALRVSDVSGLYTSPRFTDREGIAAILAAAKKDAEAFDYGAFRDGSARAAAYLLVETRDPGDYDRRPGDRDLWYSFRLPVYRTDGATLAALSANGFGEALRSHDGEAVSLMLEWWGDPQPEKGAYWTGQGPRDPDPVAGDLLRKDGDFAADTFRGTFIRGEEQVRETLDLCLGADCHPSVPGFLVTVVGKDRMGSTFWLSREDAPACVDQWYREHQEEFRQRNLMGLYRNYNVPKGE